MLGCQIHFWRESKCSNSVSARKTFEVSKEKLANHFRNLEQRWSHWPLLALGPHDELPWSWRLKDSISHIHSTLLKPLSRFLLSLAYALLCPRDKIRDQAYSWTMETMTPTLLPICRDRLRVEVLGIPPKHGKKEKKIPKPKKNILSLPLSFW